MAHFFWSRCVASLAWAQPCPEREGRLLDVLGLCLRIAGGEAVELPDRYVVDSVRLFLFPRGHRVEALVDFDRVLLPPPPPTYTDLRYALGRLGPCLGSQEAPWKAWAHVLGDVPWPQPPDSLIGFSGPLYGVLPLSGVTAEVTARAGGVRLVLRSWDVRGHVVRSRGDKVALDWSGLSPEEEERATRGRGWLSDESSAEGYNSFDSDF